MKPAQDNGELSAPPLSVDLRSQVSGSRELRARRTFWDIEPKVAIRLSQGERVLTIPGSCEKRGLYGTRNATLLESVPLGVTTCTSPLVAPKGTVVLIKYLDTTMNAATPVP